MKVIPQIRSEKLKRFKLKRSNKKLKSLSSLPQSPPSYNEICKPCDKAIKLDIYDLEDETIKEVVNGFLEKYDSKIQDEVHIEHRQCDDDTSDEEVTPQENTLPPEKIIPKSPPKFRSDLDPKSLSPPRQISNRKLIKQITEEAENDRLNLIDCIVQRNKKITSITKGFNVMKICILLYLIINIVYN